MVNRACSWASTIPDICSVPAKMTTEAAVTMSGIS